MRALGRGILTVNARRQCQSFRRRYSRRFIPKQRRPVTLITSPLISLHYQSHELNHAVSFTMCTLRARRL